MANYELLTHSSQLVIHIIYITLHPFCFDKDAHIKHLMAEVLIHYRLGAEVLIHYRLGAEVLIHYRLGAVPHLS